MKMCPDNTNIVVDAHFHLWQKEVAGKTWLTEELEFLFRSYTPEDFAEESATVGVPAGILVESGITAEENESMQQMAASSSRIAALIAYVDLESPRLSEELDRWQRNPKFRGVRMRLEGHSDPNVLKRSALIRGFE